MKKKGCKSIISLLLIVGILTCLLSACTTKLNGTYTNNDDLIVQSITFEDDNKVEISAFGINVEGEYLIEDDTITFTYSLLNLSYDMVKSFEKDGNAIIIDGTVFVKEK